MSDVLTSYSVEDGIALLRLERDQARNAMNTAMLEEMLEHLGSASGDDDVRVLEEDQAAVAVVIGERAERFGSQRHLRVELERGPEGDGQLSRRRTCRRWRSPR